MFYSTPEGQQPHVAQLPKQIQQPPVDYSSNRMNPQMQGEPSSQAKQPLYPIDFNIFNFEEKVNAIPDSVISMTEACSLLNKGYKPEAESSPQQQQLLRVILISLCVSMLPLQQQKS